MRFTPISVGLLVYCTAACSATSKDGPSAPDEPGGADTGGSTGASGAAGNAIGGENAGGQSPGTSGSGGVVGTGGAGVAVGTGGAGGASAGKDGGTGGSGKSGGADGGGADGGGATHVAKNCQALAAAGVWENITPPVTVLPGAAPCPYGGAFVENPLDPTMLYVGSCNQGIWKTTDCGANWVHINTGKNGGALDSGRQWTFVIDPVDPNVLYANSGYNTWVPSGTWDGNGTSGAFKSTNGGVDWQVMWPPADADLAKVVQYNFVAQVVMDPSVHTHLLITFHATCGAPHTQACFGESTDSGSTWHLIDGQANWAGGEGQAVYFLNDSKTWLWGSQSNGLWRTSNSGSTWAAVTDKQAQGHGAGQLYRAKDGTFYLPVLNGVLRSTDGITWNIVPNSGNTMMGAIGNGTTMYASRGFPWDPSTVLYEPFWSSPEGDGLHWTQMNSPMLSNGGELQYDSDHHILYSSNLGAGFWRVVTQ